MANAIVSSLSPEQKLQRVRKAFLVYERAFSVSQMHYEQALKLNLEWHKTRFEYWQRRTFRARRYILRLTAPAGGEPTPAPEPETDATPLNPVTAPLFGWLTSTPSSTSTNWPCCVCGEPSVEEREDHPVCDEHRAMIDSGVFTLDELLDSMDALDSNGGAE